MEREKERKREREKERERESERVRDRERECVRERVQAFRTPQTTAPNSSAGLSSRVLYPQPNELLTCGDSDLLHYTEAFL